MIMTESAMRNYRDTVTGFIGKKTAYCKYYDGSANQVLLDGLDNAGHPIQWWFNEDRLEEVGEE